MTGRAAGYCAGYPAPGYANPIPYARLGVRAGYANAGMPYAPAGLGAYPVSYPASPYAAPYAGAYRVPLGRGLGRGFVRGLGFGFGRGRGRGRGWW